MSFNSCGTELLDVHSSAREIEDYIERFELWCVTKSKLTDELKTAYFLTAIGKDAYTLIKNLSYPHAPSTRTFDQLKNILLAYVRPTNFEIAERSKFNTLQRQPDQSIREFILQIQTQASRCSFGDHLNEQLRDRLIAGINMPELYRQLLLIEKPTFEKIRDLCEQFQDVTEVSKSAHSSEKQDILFGHSHSHRNKRPYKQQQFKSIANKSSGSFKNISSNNNKMGKCKSCGKMHSRYSCPHRNSQCFKCGKSGHIQAVCHSTKSCKLTNVSDSNIYNVTDNFDSLTLSVSTNSASHLYKTIQFSNKKSHEFIIDTGSIESIISKSNLDSLFPRIPITPTAIQIRGITGHSLHVLGRCFLTILNDDGLPVNCSFLVTETGPSIIGLQSIRQLNINVTLLTDSELKSEIRNLIHDCSMASGGMNITPVHLEVSGEPIFLKRRLIPYGLREPVYKQIESLCQKNILVPVDSSSWATPIVTPLKADGLTPRICGDYRVTLNTRLLQRSCTTEEPEAILSRLNGSCVFSKIDLKDAYLQLPLDEESSVLTTINTPFGLYRYRFLPFGLSASPAIFQDVMNRIVEGLKGVELYQDDVIVHGPNKIIHDERLRELLICFKKANVNINPAKCSVGVNQFNCLGYHVSSDGFCPDQNRLQPLLNVKSPSNIHELRSIMGALQYYSKFIPNFASKADSLFTLLNTKSYKWLDIHEQVLRKLLRMLSSCNILRPFSPRIRSTLITDASPTGIGAVLEQNGHPVICISRRLSKAEQGYAQTHREALAIYWAVTRLHKYLFGLKFSIVTDHEALKFIYNPTSSLAKSSAAMVQRWSIALSAYDYDITHCKGSQIPHVDFLSRHSSMCESDNNNCLLIQPLPIPRCDLISDTKRYYGHIMAAIKRGWSNITKRKFPQFYSRREELSITLDGLLCINDRIVIPPTLRSAVLKDLHSGHLGVEKMKSLARCLRWWPELDADIKKTASACDGCRHKLQRQPSKWTPWPMACEAWQRIHMDYCGPFFQKYYALVIIDSYSKWPEVFFTEKPNAEFTIRALRKVFSREGVPLAVVSDNGTHFTASCVTNWLKSLGCHHVFTAPRHPQSNGLAENFVGTLKRAIKSCAPTSIHELDKFVDNFLLQYRNCTHSSTGNTPSQLCKSRSLRSNMLGLNSAEVFFYRGNDYRPSTGIVLNNLGNRIIRILDLDDCTIHKRHTDQVTYKDTGQLSFDNNSIDNSNSVPVQDNSIVDNIPQIRRSERIQNKPSQNYKFPKHHSSCGGCDDCNNNNY